MTTRFDRSRLALFSTCAFAFGLVLVTVFVTPSHFGYVGLRHFAGDWNLTSGLAIEDDLQSGLPLAKAGLRPGDRIWLTGSSVWDRIEHSSQYLAGDRLHVQVQRGSRRFETTVIPVNLPPPADHWLAAFQAFWVSIVAAIIACYGRGYRARLLAWMLVLNATSTLLSRFYFMTPWPIANLMAVIGEGVAGNVSLALVATIASSFGRPLNQLRRALELSAYAVLAANMLLAVSESLWFPLGLYTPFSFPDASRIVFFAAILLVIGASIAGLAFARNDEKLQARWLLIPLIAYIALDVPASLLDFAPWTRNIIVSVVFELASFLLPLALTYAVLRRRLIDVEFAINRAAVFTIVSFIVVGIFVFAEWVFNEAFSEATRTQGSIVALGIALALGVSLRYIHSYVDKIVDRTLFRKRHEREKALRDFANEVTFITDREVLLDDTVHEIQKSAEADAVAILLHDGNGAYCQVRTTNGAEMTVSENDRAILKLRAWHRPIDLDNVETSLEGKRAYPLTSRGELLGILVCGSSHDGQGFAPDEDAALLALAQGVGSALASFDGIGRRDVKSSIDALALDVKEIKDRLRDLDTTEASTRSRKGIKV